MDKINNSLDTISDYEFGLLSLRPDALLEAAKRHEATLYRINIEPLAKFNYFDQDYLRWFTHLFLMTFFYDYCLDRADEEQYPEALFVSLNMYSEYRKFIAGRYGEPGLKLLDKNNSAQVYYQMIERQWFHPAEYQRVHPDYTDYYQKQILCMTHLELLRLEDVNKAYADDFIQLYELYWSLVLLIDDIMDVARDIESHTITPMIGWFYSAYGTMPCNADADEVRAFGITEFHRLFPLFETVVDNLAANDYLAIVNSARDIIIDTGLQQR